MYRTSFGRFLMIVTICLLGVMTANIAFAGAVTPQKVEDKMANIIQSRWTCKNLVIKAIPFQNDTLTQQGRFQAIVFQADSIYRKGITVAPVYIKAFDVTVDTYQLFYKNTVRTPKRQKTIIDAKISESDLNKLLVMKEMPIKEPQVKFGNGKLTFTGKYTAMFNHNLLMEAKLQVEKNSKVNLVPTKVSVNKVPLPAGPVKSLLSKINPLLDTSDMPLEPRFSTIIITPKFIELKG